MCSFVHTARVFFIRHPVIFSMPACMEGSFVNIKDHFLQYKHAGVDYPAHKPAAALLCSRTSRLRVKMSEKQLEALRLTKIDVNKHHLSRGGRCC